MYNANRPDASDLPSTSQLLKSTGVAAIVAGVLLAIVVLPAEYGVDPTGVGSVLGLTQMGRIKMQLAQEAVTGAAPLPAPSEAPASVPVSSIPQQRATSSAPSIAQDEITFQLAPNASHEIKLVMEKDASVRYAWFTDGPGVNYDTHADAPGISYHGYSKGVNEDRLEGDLKAAFKGSHGWFWRNRGGQAVTVTLQVRGDYTEVKRY